MKKFDYVLVGGGLQSGLLVLALRARQPSATIALIEKESRLGGNHTWCFHETDVGEESLDWIDPIVVHRWAGYRVLFPHWERAVNEAYSGVSTERFDRVVSAAVNGHPGSLLLLGSEATAVEQDRVHLATGTHLEGHVVVDARGPLMPNGPAQVGYQKFLGLEVELTLPHGLDLPILMDARVDQSDGFRFVYVLPLGDRCLLVEDTYFSESSFMSPNDLRGQVLSYATERGWEISRVVRQESGVLPMPWAGAFEFRSTGPLMAGYRGGWFHPGTGYSFPVAVRLAEFVANRSPADLFGPDLEDLSRQHRRQAAFVQILNRMLFRWYPPHARRSVFERFYKLPEQTIGNFYALQLKAEDCRRLLLGHPPRGLSIRHRFRGGNNR